MNHDYRILETLHAGRLSRVQRAIHIPTGERVVKKTCAADYPSTRDIARIYHEWNVLSDIDSPHIVRARELDESTSTPSLILEDGRAPGLEHRLGTPMGMAHFFALARRLASALDALHCRGYIHRDIKPDNILFDTDHSPERDDVTFCLLDFDMAARMTEIHDDEQHEDLVAGTLAYMAPEQAARTGPTMDERSDLYAAGVLFYQLIAGRLPFDATAALELIHQHRTALPEPLHAHRADTPGTVVAIVDRLLAKNPVDRYQSARGLLFDLEQAERRWCGAAAAGDFVIGSRDISHRLQVPHALYGREREIEILAAAGQRARRGEALLVLIAGAAGSGKSSLVRVFERHGLDGSITMAAGKCDELQRSVPQKPILDALRHVLRSVLALDERDLARWATRMQEAVSPNGAVLLPVLPEIELIIGPQPALPPVGLVESSNRFRDTLRKLIQCMARSGAPLVLFIDDLQWADPATLAVLRALLADPAAKNLLVIGAFRATARTPESGIPDMLQALVNADVAVERIATHDLDIDGVVALLADTLHTDGARVAPLARLVHKKTHGNPFFVRQFVTQLYRSGLIGLDRHILMWVWDEGRIARADITDNVVELMVARMRELDPGVQELLQWAACLGSRCDLAMLAALAPERSLGDIATRIMAALRDGVLVTAMDTERLLGSLPLRSSATLQPAELAGTRVRFLHDRVQQAAYELIPEDDRPALHLRIGRLLRRHLGEREIDRHLFDIVEHYLAGEALMADPAERLDLVAPATRAARRARSANAYAAGVRYARFAARLLPRDDESYLDERFDLGVIEAECLSLGGEHAAADALCSELEALMQRKDQRATLYEVRIQQHITHREWDSAFALIFRLLEQYGESFPGSDAQAQGLIAAELALLLEKLGPDPVARLRAADVTDEREHQVVTANLVAIFRVGYQSDRSASGVLATLRALSYSLDHGFSGSSAYTVCIFAFLLTHVFGQPELGMAIAGVGAEWTAKNPDPAERAISEIALVALLSHWHQPVQQLLARCEMIGELATSSGAYEYMGYAINNLLIMSFYAGRDLRELDRLHRQHLITLRRIQTPLSMSTAHALAHGLRQLTGTSIDIPGDDASVINGVRHELRIAIELRAALHVPRPENEIAALIAEQRRVAVVMIATAGVWESTFTCAMHSIRLARDSQGEARAAHLQQAHPHIKALRDWAARGNVNLVHKLCLIEAELAALEDRGLDALQAYEKAMAGSAELMCPHDEALAAERAAALCSAIALPHMAHHYLTRARAAYDRWGALVKVHELDERLGLGTASPDNDVSPATATGALALHMLDMESVLKTALAIGQELRLSRLLEVLLRVLMESAGADRAAVLMMRENELAVVAEARAQDGITVLPDSARPLSAWQDGPQSAVRYVQRTRAIEVVGDAVAHITYGRDPYVRAHQARSMVCMPIEARGGLLAVLYLENRALVDSFTRTQLALLSVLAGQIATSLENARLYAELEQAMRELAESERLKLEFLATISHELRTPLNAVINMPGILMDKLPDDESGAAQEVLLREFSVADIRDMLGTVQQSGRQLWAAIEQMILFSRLEAGMQPFEPVAMSLEQAIADVLARLAPRARERDITIAVDTRAPGDAGDAIQGDPRMIELVIENLLNNAIKFSAAGSRVALCSAAKGPFIELSVRDQGPGISAEDRARIFDIFRQTSTGTKRRHGGTGLGLTIVKRLVDLHGGAIAVESIVGQGSTFTVTLPR